MSLLELDLAGGAARLSISKYADELLEAQQDAARAVRLAHEGRLDDARITADCAHTRADAVLGKDFHGLDALVAVLEDMRPERASQ